MAFPVFPFLASTVSNLVNLGRQGDGSLRIPFQTTIVDSPGPLTDVSTILSARGAFYRVELSGRRGPAMYAIDELTRDRTFPEVFPFAQNLAFDSETQTDEENYQELADRNQRSLALQEQQNAAGTFAPVLITGIQLAQSDITSAVPCLDNFKIFYTFGQNFGQVAITGEILLGPHGEVEARGFNRVVQFFAKHRVSVSNRPIKLSILTQVYLVYLTGLQLGRIDPQYHILPFTLTGTLLDPSNDEPGKVNTRTEVLGTGARPTLFDALAINPDNLTVAPATDATAATAATDGQSGENSLPPELFEEMIYGTSTAPGATISHVLKPDNTAALKQALTEAQVRNVELMAALPSDDWRAYVNAQSKRNADQNVETRRRMLEIDEAVSAGLPAGWNASLDWLHNKPAAAIEAGVEPVRNYLNEAGDLTSRSIQFGVDAVGDWFTGRPPAPQVDWNGPVP